MLLNYCWLLTSSSLAVRQNVSRADPFESEPRNRGSRCCWSNGFGGRLIEDRMYCSFLVFFLRRATFDDGSLLRPWL